MRRLLRASLALALAAVLACGGPPATRIERLYRALDEDLRAADPSVLAGRRIVIDPGHGGALRGTHGPSGLDEADVNLGVALYLWGLLREAGADAILTRSADRDFLSPDDSTVAGDLERRVARVDSLQPDAFVSIHHNAQPQRDPSVNVLDTYYRAGDPASRELAFAVHRHLARNLGVPSGAVRQGNYYVLRRTSVPAVLGESAYLTHPAVERRLRLAEAQRLEAEAWFLGLVDYFSRGIPRVFAPALPGTLAVDTLAFVARVVDDGGAGIDPDAVRLVARPPGGAPRAATAELVPGPGDTLRVRWRLPPDAPNGRWRFTLAVRNALGNSARPVTLSVRLARPPAMVTARAAGAPPAGRTGDALVRVRVLDALGLAVADGTPVQVRGAAHLDARTRDGAVVVPVRYGPSGGIELVVTCEGRTFRVAAGRPDAGRAWHRLVVVDAATGEPVRGARAVDGLRTGRRGEVLAAVDDTVRVVARGYAPVRVTPPAPDTVRLRAWFDGVLRGRRIVIDPEAGPDAGTGPLGLDGAWVNLRVAQYLAADLRTAGADVWTTRDDERVPAPADVARRTNRWGADRYVEVRHRRVAPDSASGLRVWHFPASRRGYAMAAHLAAVLGRELGEPVRGVGATVTYPLQQTACPAVVVEFPDIADRDVELELDDPAGQRRQARALLDALAAHFAATDSAGDVEGVRPPGAVVTVRVPDPPAGWIVTIDGAFTRLTDAAGTAAFAGVPPGLHVIEARRRGRRRLWRGTVADSVRSVDLRVLPAR